MGRFFFFFATVVASLSGSSAEKYGGRIVNGEFVDILEFPYQVALTVTTEGGAISLCGGSIIDKNWIVTAAHCLVNAQSAVVRAGSNYSDKKGQAIVSTSFTIHPDYHNTDNDVALIHLPKDLNFNNPKIQPIEMAATGSVLLPDSLVTTSGWGTTTEGGDISPALQAVTLLSIDHDQCKSMLSDFMITENMICAGGFPGKDTCQGDSGGPLVSNEKVLVGIISWGKGCARPESPGVYTNIASVRNWIESVTDA